LLDFGDKKKQIWGPGPLGYMHALKLKIKLNLLLFQARLTEETDEKAENDSTNNESPVPHVIITYECNAEEHKDDTVTRRTTMQQQQQSAANI